MRRHRLYPLRLAAVEEVALHSMVEEAPEAAVAVVRRALLEAATEAEVAVARMAHQAEAAAPEEAAEAQMSHLEVEEALRRTAPEAGRRAHPVAAVPLAEESRLEVEDQQPRRTRATRTRRRLLETGRLTPKLGSFSKRS